jgi:hypothetical protein
MRPVACIAAVALALGTIPGQAAAQNPAPRAVQILLLGTKGGPDLSRDRSEPATLLIFSIRGVR